MFSKSRGKIANVPAVRLRGSMFVEIDKIEKEELDSYEYREMRLYRGGKKSDLERTAQRAPT